MSESCPYSASTININSATPAQLLYRIISRSFDIHHWNCRRSYEDVVIDRDNETRSAFSLFRSLVTMNGIGRRGILQGEVNVIGSKQSLCPKGYTFSLADGKARVKGCHNTKNVFLLVHTISVPTLCFHHQLPTFASSLKSPKSIGNSYKCGNRRKWNNTSAYCVNRVTIQRVGRDLAWRMMLDLCQTYLIRTTGVNIRVLTAK